MVVKVMKVKMMGVIMKVRSSRSQMLFKIGILKNFAISTRKQLGWSFFVIKLQALRELLKNTFFYRTPPVAAPESNKLQQLRVLPIIATK